MKKRLHCWAYVLFAWWGRTWSVYLNGWRRVDFTMRLAHELMSPMGVQCWCWNDVYYLILRQSRCLAKNLLPKLVRKKFRASTISSRLRHQLAKMVSVFGVSFYWASPFWANWICRLDPPRISVCDFLSTIDACGRVAPLLGTVCFWSSFYLCDFKANLNWRALVCGKITSRFNLYFHDFIRRPPGSSVVYP